MANNLISVVGSPDGPVIDTRELETHLDGSPVLAGKLGAKANATSLALKLDKTEAADTYAQTGLTRWKRKLAARASDMKIVFMGDSTSEEGNVAKAIRERLQLIHAAPNEGLAGVDPAKIKLLGWGGTTQAGWWDAHGAAVVAEAPDLLVYSLGINSVRTGLVNQAQLTAGITADIDAIKTALPNADIILRMPNPLTTTDGGNGWVTPNSNAQTYTDILRNTYLSLEGKWPNVVVWNSQDQVFGRSSKPTTDYSGLMGDQLHPSPAGYQAIADSLTAELIGRPRRFTSQPRNIDMHSASRPANPYTVGDKVDRADAATPGNASSGQAYTADLGTFGVVSGRIKKTDAGSTSIVSLDAGISDGEFGVTFTTVDPASTQVLVFRKIAGNNLLYFRRMTNQWHLGQLVNGTATNLATDTTTPGNNGDRVAVVCQGSSIKAYVNDNLILSATTTQFQTATRIGIQANSTVSAYADLYAKKLV